MDFTHYSDRFLGLPETPLSPQFLLIGIMEDPLFNLCNVLLLNTFLFLGLLLIRREHKLFPIPFIFLCLLYE